MIKSFLEYSPYALLNNNKLNIYLSSIEDLFYENKINMMAVDNPIFISGLSRSGTTSIANFLDKFDGLSSYKYNNLPFIHCPIIWSYFSKFYYFGLKDTERLHGDGIMVGTNNADAFEEIFWKIYLEKNKLKFDTVLENENNDDYNIYIKYKIKKLLYLTDGKRYFSKNNYNILRLKYLNKQFISPKFLICFRNPIDTAISMTKIDKKFSGFEKKNKYFNKILNAIGHYEFGSEKKAININQENFEKVNFLWSKNKFFEGYLLQWIDIYKFIINNYSYLNNIILVDNKDFCEKTEQRKVICNFLNLNHKNDKFGLSKYSEYDKSSHSGKEISLSLEIYQELKRLSYENFKTFN